MQETLYLLKLCKNICSSYNCAGMTVSLRIMLETLYL